MSRTTKIVMTLVAALVTGIGIAAGDGIRDIVRTELAARRAAETTGRESEVPAINSDSIQRGTETNCRRY